MANLVYLYFLFTLFTWWVYQKHSDKILYNNGTAGILAIWNLRHLTGIFLLFVAPLIFMKMPVVAMSSGIYNTRSFFSILLIGSVLLNLSIQTGFNLPMPVNRNYSRNEVCTAGIILRAIFLAAYEFFFRGVLLFTLASTKGQFVAVIIATSLYTLVHFGSSIKEIIATIPFGFFLCWITIETKSLLPAIILHWLIALPSEIIASIKVIQCHQKRNV